MPETFSKCQSLAGAGTGMKCWKQLYSRFYFFFLVGLPLIFSDDDGCSDDETDDDPTSCGVPVLVGVVLCLLMMESG